MQNTDIRDQLTGNLSQMTSDRNINTIESNILIDLFEK